MSEGLAIALLAVLGFSLRLRQPGDHDTGRRRRMTQQFRQAFAAAEQLERERFIARIQAPLERQRDERARWAANLDRHVNRLSGLLPGSTAYHLFVVLLGLGGAWAVVAVGTHLRGIVQTLGVHDATATSTATGVTILLACIGVIASEGLRREPVLRLQPGIAVLAAGVVVAIAVVLAQVVPPPSTYQMTGDPAPLECAGLEAPHPCADSARGVPASSRVSARLLAAALPLVGVGGAACLGPALAVCLWASLAVMARWHRRRAAIAQRWIDRQRAVYVADVAWAAERAGVAPGVVALAAHAA